MDPTTSEFSRGHLGTACSRCCVLCICPCNQCIAHQRTRAHTRTQFLCLNFDSPARVGGHIPPPCSVPPLLHSRPTHCFSQHCDGTCRPRCVVGWISIDSFGKNRQAVLACLHPRGGLHLALGHRSNMVQSQVEQTQRHIDPVFRLSSLCHS